jgi:hypothetical protein
MNGEATVELKETLAETFENLSQKERTIIHVISFLLKRVELISIKHIYQLIDSA